MVVNIQDTIRCIQEEARLKVETARFSKSKPFIPKDDTIAQTPTVDEVVASLREQLSTAIAQALSTKAARRYVGDITESLQDIAAEVVESDKNKVDFGGSAQNNGKVVIYPNNCKLLIQNGNGQGSLIIEEPPQYRTVLWNNEHNRKTQTYRIALPYMVYLIGFQQIGAKYNHIGCGIGFGKKPIDSIDSRLLNPSLPHAHGNTHICQPMDKTNHNSVKELSEYIVQTFWNTTFHYKFEDSGCSFDVGDKQIKSFADWESKVKNPLDILKATFIRGETVQNVLSQLGRVTRVRGGDSVNQKVQSAVSRVVNGINNSISAEDLAAVIRQTAEEIVDIALQNAIGDSALQQSKVVV